MEPLTTLKLLGVLTEYDILSGTPLKAIGHVLPNWKILGHVECALCYNSSKWSCVMAVTSDFRFYIRDTKPDTICQELWYRTQDSSEYGAYVFWSLLEAKKLSSPNFKWTITVIKQPSDEAIEQLKVMAFCVNLEDEDEQRS